MKPLVLRGLNSTCVTSKGFLPLISVALYGSPQLPPWAVCLEVPDVISEGFHQCLRSLAAE